MVIVCRMYFRGINYNSDWKVQRGLSLSLCWRLNAPQVFLKSETPELKARINNYIKLLALLHQFVLCVNHSMSLQNVSFRH